MRVALGTLAIAVLLVRGFPLRAEDRNYVVDSIEKAKLLPADAKSLTLRDATPEMVTEATKRAPGVKRLEVYSNALTAKTILTINSELPGLEALTVRGLPYSQTDVIDEVCKLASLKELDLGDGQLPPETSFALLVNLRRIQLNTYTPNAEGAIASLSGLKQLQHLDVRYVTASLFAAICGLTQLKELHAEKCEFIFPKDALLKIGKLKNLETLWMSDGPAEALGVPDAAMITLGGLLRLKKLYLEGASFETKAGMAALTQSASLEELTLHDCGVEPRLVGELAGSKTLRRLKLSWLNVGDEAALRLFRMPNLELLDFKGCTDIKDSILEHATECNIPEFCPPNNWGYSTAERIAGLARMPHLRRLVLSGTLSDKDLAPISAMKELVELDLGWVQGISNEGLAKFAALSQLQKLTLPLDVADQINLDWLEKHADLIELSISGSNIDKSAAIRISKLPKLESLKFWVCTFSQDAIQIIASCKGLKVLSLDGSKLTDKKAKLDVRELTSLETLSLDYCEWVSPQVVTGVSKLHALKSLVLTRCKTPQDLLDQVETLANLEQLKIDLWDDDLKPIKARLPFCSFDWD